LLDDFYAVVVAGMSTAPLRACGC